MIIAALHSARYRHRVNAVTNSLHGETMQNASNKMAQNIDNISTHAMTNV